MSWNSICRSALTLSGAENIHFYTLNAVDIARELGLGGRFNMLMQAAFLLAAIIDPQTAADYLKQAVEKKATAAKGRR